MWQKGGKLAKITINREAVLTVDKAQLPADAEFKGYEDCIVQDVVLRTDNVLFHKEKYYSPKRGGDASGGPAAGLRGPVWAWGSRRWRWCSISPATWPSRRSLEFFANVGIQLSAGELSNWLIKDWPDLHAEKAAIYEAGLRSSPWQHLDDTATVVNGQNEHCHVLCNPLYTAYFTTARKDRLTIVDVLRNLGARTFRLSMPKPSTCCASSGWRSAPCATCRACRKTRTCQKPSSPPCWMPGCRPWGRSTRARILEAAAVAAYHAQLEFPVIKLLLCDDAPQFNWVTEQLALCWIHEGRHYKKLDPSSAPFRTALTEFTKQFWE